MEKATYVEDYHKIKEHANIVEITNIPIFERKHAICFWSIHFTDGWNHTYHEDVTTNLDTKVLVYFGYISEKTSPKSHQITGKMTNKPIDLVPFSENLKLYHDIPTNIPLYHKIS